MYGCAKYRITLVWDKPSFNYFKYKKTISEKQRYSYF
jgi:hypothetical protein